MYNVYRVCTWDDVTYTEVSSHETKEVAEKECERLIQERRKLNLEIDPITYCVMSDIKYDLLMR